MNYNDEPDKVTALLKRWTKSSDEVKGKIMTVCVDRMADHWDTIVSNGDVLLDIRRLKHPEGIDTKFGTHFNSELFWGFSHIERNENIEPAKRRLIERVPEEIRAQIAADPDLGSVEWVRIKYFNLTSCGSRGVRHIRKPAPKDFLFFRFDGGLGIAVCEIDVP